MNTRVYRNSAGQITRDWDTGPDTEVRRSTPMERAKSHAATYSAIVLLVMLTLAVTITTIALNTKKPVEDVGTTPIVFAMPVTGTFNVTKYYSDSTLQWNETAKQWQGFKAVNIQAELGSAVVATYAGTITNITSDSMYGTVVKIQHKDGLMTVYSGLDPDVYVKQGDYVEKGQAIGKFGDTLKLESKDGPTLRIEVYKDGVKVDPANYIIFGDNK